MCQTLKHIVADCSDDQTSSIPLELSLKDFELVQAFLPLLDTQDQVKIILGKKSNRDLTLIANAAEYLAIPLLLKLSLEIISTRIANNPKKYRNKKYGFRIERNPNITRSIIAQLQHRMILKKIHTFDGHIPYSVNSIAFSPDRKHLASGSTDNSIKLWKLNAKKSFSTSLLGHNNSIYTVAFSPDGKHLASGSVDTTIKLWDVNTKKCLYTLLGHTNTVYSVVFSPDGKYLASGSLDNTIKLWCIDTKKCLHTFVGHANTVKSVVFSPNGKHLASGSCDKTINLWKSNIELFERNSLSEVIQELSSI